MRAARRHALAAIAALALCSVAWFAIYRLDFGRPTGPSSWIDSLYAAKEAAAARAKPPRVLLGGGSSVLFGLRADVLARQWGVPVVNLGTHAGLDLDYLLRRLEPLLAPRDTLLLTLEYELYDRDPGAFGTVLVDYLLARDPGYLKSLPLHRQVLAASGLTWDRALEPWRAKPETAPAQAVYSIGSITPSGDILGNERARRSAMAWTALAAAKPVALAIRERNLARLGDFLERCRQRGVRVIAVAPPLMAHASYAQPRYAEGWRRLEDWYGSRGVPFLLAPPESLLPRDDFFDTRYHLVGEAADRYSRRLAARLPHPIPGH